MFIKRHQQRSRANRLANRLGNSRRTGGQRAKRERLSKFEQLESRRLLVSEGDAFDVTRTFSTLGLDGALISTVRWGDGTETRGAVEGTVDSAGPLSIRFVYQGSFFSGANESRRALLQNAARTVIERFGDDLAAIRPTSLLEWEAVTENPTNGQELRIENLSVAANELVIYVGGKNLPGSQVGEAGPGGYAFPNVRGTAEELAQISAFRDTVLYRGEAGAQGANPTDFAPWGGYIAFDTGTNWHFGATTDGLEDDEVDFQSVVVHELLHVLGFGTEYAGSRNSSWETFSNSQVFTGAKARAVNGGVNIPLGDPQHVADEVLVDGQRSVVTSSIDKGERRVLSRLDLAMMDDIGWSVRAAPNVTVTASHVYGDNPIQGNRFPVEVELRGSGFGVSTQSFTATVTNVAPQLTVVGNQTIRVGSTLNLPELGTIVDPGFRNTRSDPPTAETFDYVIDWGDQSDLETGTARITQHGTADSAVNTEATIPGQHLYDAVGTYTVRVTAKDDDDASAPVRTFRVTVAPEPTLSLRLSAASVTENDGVDASILTVRRSGAAADSNQVINLSSGDTSEITLPSTVTILAGDTEAEVAVRAIDDRLLDGTQQVELTASGSDVVSGTTSISVDDHETLTLTAPDSVVEGESASFTIRRSNTDTDEPLTVAIGIPNGTAPLFEMPRTMEIAAGRQNVTFSVAAADNDLAQVARDLTYRFSAANYEVVDPVLITLEDDEPNIYHNAEAPLDVDGLGDVRPRDALLVINYLSRNGKTALDPNGESLEFRYDVNGNYEVAPLDALLVINSLARRGESEAPADAGSAMLSSVNRDDETGLDAILVDAVIGQRLI